VNVHLDDTSAGKKHFEQLLRQIRDRIAQRRNPTAVALMLFGLLICYGKTISPPSRTNDGTRPARRRVVWGDSRLGGTRPNRATKFWGCYFT